MNSTRLPGKVLKFIGDRMCLEHVISRVRLAVPLTVVTIPDDDRELKDWCLFYKVPFSMGPENDLLSRYVTAAKEYDADVIVRVTADCPFIDPDLIKKVAWMGENLHTGMLRGWAVSTYKVIHGLECEAYAREYLEKMDKRVTNPEVREGMDLARLASRISPEWAKGNYRWTLDTPEDLEFFRAVAEKIDVTPPKPSIEELKELLRKEPQICAVNT